MKHSLLKRQLKKSELTDDNAPTKEEWKIFLNNVEKAYREADKERYLLERSLLISSEEMYEVHAKLRESENRYALSAKGSNDGLWDWNIEKNEYYYSLRWKSILGLEDHQENNSSKECWLERIHPEDKETVIKEIELHLEGKSNHFKNEHRVKSDNGTYVWVLARGMAVKNSDGKAIRIAGSLTDITNQKSVEQKLAFDALHDPLTGLPNRKKLIKRLAELNEPTAGHLTTPYSVLFIDIDRFKMINDSLGHQAGDELLLHVTDKLKALVRPNDTVARLGGDEFLLLIEESNCQKIAKNIAQRLLDSLETPISILNEDIYISVSIGIATSSKDNKQTDDIIRNADIAMYQAKMNGKSRYEVYEASFQLGKFSQFHIEKDLPRGYKNKEFELHYQPILSLNPEEIVGFEALVRWEHPKYGLIPPNEFIPIAEQSGLINKLGDWILFEACRQMKEWEEAYPNSKDLIVSVNISTRQIEKQNLLTKVKETLNKTGIRPNKLRFEITESVIMSNAELAVSTVNKLRELGVRVSIDDFGTGYSSLSYLHRFPVDTIKVDRSFINRIGANGENSEIVQTILTLAYNLNMDVVAEGVETREQLEFLKQTNCNYGQGYYYSKPLDKNAAETLLVDLEEENNKMQVKAPLNINEISRLIN